MKVGGSWQILFAAEETKTHVPYEAVLPAALAPKLGRYLDAYRPVLLRGGPGGRIPTPRRSIRSSTRSGCRKSEPSSRMRPLHSRSSSDTRREFGRGLSPHMFRDAAATAIAVDNPKHIGDASLVLGHAGHRMTEKHYNHARSLDASRRHAATLARLRESLKANGNR